MSMRITLTLQYIGTNYHGWQIQPNGLTIQEVLQKALKNIFQKEIHVFGASRTDSGAHALGQVCHFNVPMCRCADVLMLKTHRLRQAINSQLPDDIVVTHAEKVPEKVPDTFEKVPDTFHAQQSAKKKIYDYYIFNSPIPSPFLKDYSWRVSYPLNLLKMKKAAKLLVGERDFKAFCAADSTVKTTVRRVYRITVDRRSPFAVRISQIADRKNNFLAISDQRSTICVTITGNGFLKQMVRNIVGTLVEIGRGKMTLIEFKKAFKSCDRRRMGMTAPAKGLFLRSVEY